MIRFFLGIATSWAQSSPEEAPNVGESSVPLVAESTDSGPFEDTTSVGPSRSCVRAEGPSATDHGNLTSYLSSADGVLLVTQGYDQRIDILEVLKGPREFTALECRSFGIPSLTPFLLLVTVTDDGSCFPLPVFGRPQGDVWGRLAITNRGSYYTPRYIRILTDGSIIELVGVDTAGLYEHGRPPPASMPEKPAENTYPGTQTFDEALELVRAALRRPR